ncbi:sensor histidine kinase, partial [Bacteroides thetaiotaomicron]
TEKGYIHFGYAVDPVNADFVNIFVEDTGSGIPQECQKEIFDRFYKVDTFKQGTGLGLSICKTIVEHLQGDISVESEMGKGSRFIVTLPFERQTED